MVEPFAIHTDDGTLRDKCFRVYIFNQAENSCRLTLLGQYEHHFHSQPGVHSGPVYHRHTTVEIFIDAMSNFFISLGNNKELYRLAGTVYHLVKHKTRYIKRGKTINDLFPIMQYKITGRNDNHIRHQNNTS